MRLLTARVSGGVSDWALRRAQVFGASRYLDCPVCAREAAAVYRALGASDSLDLDKPIRELFPTSWLAQGGGVIQRLLVDLWLERLLGSSMAKRKMRLEEVLLRSARQVIATRARNCDGCTCPRN
jgi:hypothetical protein